MEQDHVAGDPVNYEVHFMHSDNPRHGFRVMSMNPLTFYDFQTPVGFLETHTIVRGDSSALPFPFKYLLLTSQPTLFYCFTHNQVTDISGATVVTFNWFGWGALGTMTWPGPPIHEEHMGVLVMPQESMPE